MLEKTIENYDPKNEQETVDKALILAFIKRNPDALWRSNLLGHLTASAFVVNPSMTKILFAYHKIYDSWGWVGGHCDGDADLLAVAIKETKEETGLSAVRPYSDTIFTLDVIYVENHLKNGAYVPDHLHLNVAYLLIADETLPLQVNEQEHLAVKWFLLDEVMGHVTEPRMVAVYEKAFKAIKALRKKG